MATTDARDIYRRWINELWSGDPEKADDVAAELLADDFVGHWPDQDVKGARNLVKLIGETRAAYDDLTFVVTVGPIVDGTYVAGRWAGEGQNAKGPDTFFGNDILRLDQGKIVEYWTAAQRDPRPAAKHPQRSNDS